jgi:hypothetical protein
MQPAIVPFGIAESCRLDRTYRQWRRSARTVYREGFRSVCGCEKGDFRRDKVNADRGSAVPVVETAEVLNLQGKRSGDNSAAHEVL